MIFFTTTLLLLTVVFACIVTVKPEDKMREDAEQEAWIKEHQKRKKSLKKTENCYPQKRRGKRSKNMYLENPFEKEFQMCQSQIEEYEAALTKEKELKNLLVTRITNFYTEKLQGSYYKNEKTGKIGQIDKAFYKSGVFFLRIYYLDVTTNSKIRKMYWNIELFGTNMEDIRLLSEEEYKNEFFNYVDPHIVGTEKS